MSMDQKKQETPGQALLRIGKHLLLHNWGFKAMAILISILLWAGLISQDETITREKTFNDVSVNITGTDTMKRNGYIVVSDMSEALKGVSAVAAVPQHQYERAEASAYNIRVDLSRLNGTGEQEIRLLSSSSSTFGRVTSLTPGSIPVQVEEYVTRYRIPVSVSVTGETPEGWYMSSPNVDPPLVVVSGPRSLVNSISRGRAFLNPDDIEWTEGTTVRSEGLILFNRSGEEVDSTLLEISYDNVKLDSVVLEMNILPTRTYETLELIDTINQVKKGYELKAIHISPESITVAARGEVLNQMAELALSEHYVDLKGLSDTTSFQIKVSKPSDDAVLSNDTITVTVDIGPIEAEETSGQK